MKALFHSTFLQRVCSCLLLLGLLFAFPLNVNAADGSENINTIDMNVSANVTIDTTPNVDGGVVTEDIEIEKSVVNGVSGFNGYIQYVFPSPTDIINERRLFAEICLVDNFSIVSGHEYNLKFDWSYNINLPSFSIGLLRFYNNDGEIIKEQSLFVSNGSKASKHHNVDISFIPDTKDLTTGYRCELVIVFQQNGYNNTSQSQRFYLSPEIVLIDKDDDSGWFQKILNKINDVWESVKALPDKVGTYISSLGDRIDEAFQVVGDGIVDGIREALQWAFVPSEEYLDGFADSWQSWFESHFGVFSQVTNFLVDMIGEFEDLFTGNYSFVFPEVSVPIMDKNIVLIEEQTVDIAQWLEAGSFGARLYEIYTTCVWAIVIYCVMKYALVVQDIIFAGNRMVLNET